MHARDLHLSSNRHTSIYSGHLVIQQQAPCAQSPAAHATPRFVRSATARFVLSAVGLSTNAICDRGGMTVELPSEAEIGVEHLVDLVFHLAADKDKPADRKVARRGWRRRARQGGPGREKVPRSRVWECWCTERGMRSHGGRRRHSRNAHSAFPLPAWCPLVASTHSNETKTM